MANSSDGPEANNETENQHHGGKKKNLAIISLAFLGVFTAYNGVTNLQSSLNVEEDVGLHSLALFNAGGIFASLFLTTPIIFIFGYKWSIVAGQVALLAFVAGNIYPHPVLLYPISGIGGIFLATMWTSQSSYITVLGADENQKDDDETKVNRYFGIFFSVYQTAEIWGNLVSFLILRNTAQSSKNDTTKCGSNFLESEQLSTEEESSVSPTTIYILFGVFSAIILMSIVLVIIFLDQKRKLEDDDSESVLHTTMNYSLKTLKQFLNLDHILLAPLTFSTYTSVTFIFAVYTVSFISCTLNIAQIGLAMAGYGITASISSVIIGYLAKLKYGRPGCIFLASLLSYIIFIVMLVWMPNVGQAYVLYILACIAGFINATFVTFVPALYGIIFPDTKETAFSILQFIESAAGLVVLMSSTVLRVRVSIILQIVYLSVGIVSYVVSEIRHWKTPEKKNSSVTVLNDLVITNTNETLTHKF